MKFHPKKRSTSWGNSAQWYNKLVGETGHYYHEHVIFPHLLRLLNLHPGDSILDIGCGQGAWARQLPKGVSYTGIDIAQSLVSLAKRQDPVKDHEYVVADATKPFLTPSRLFTCVTAILSLQNMEQQEAAIHEVSKHLTKSGKFVFVLNHPAFRIPRQSGWGISENKQQYRYVNRYISPMKIPITMHPGAQQSAVTWSFHYPIQAYVQFLYTSGFVIEQLEEWVSDKESVGKASKMENRARAEIPLFLAISAKKTS